MENDETHTSEEEKEEVSSEGDEEVKELNEDKE